MYDKLGMFANTPEQKKIEPKSEYRTKQYIWTKIDADAIDKNKLTERIQNGEFRCMRVTKYNLGVSLLLFYSTFLFLSHTTNSTIMERPFVTQFEQGQLFTFLCNFNSFSMIYTSLIEHFTGQKLCNYSDFRIENISIMFKFKAARNLHSLEMLSCNAIELKFINLDYHCG